jgi:hypothetical protein
MNIAEVGFSTFVIVIVVFILAILIVQYIWNAVIPDIFPGSKQIGFWQTVGLLILVNILFGGHCNATAFAHY